MKRLTLFLILLSSCLLLQARDCPRCHGNRQIKTRIGGMGSFGIDTSQMVCPHCGEVIMRSETHWDKCPVCDGTGQVADTPGQQHAQDRLEEAEDALLEFMTPEEVILMEDLMRQLFTPIKQYVDCETCQGTGKCKQCGGYMNVSLDGPLCPICRGSGFCIACDGRGYSRIDYVENPNRDVIIQRINELYQGARERSGQSVGLEDMPADDGQQEMDQSDMPFTPMEQPGPFGGMALLVAAGVVLGAGGLAVIGVIAWLLFRMLRR